MGNRLLSQDTCQTVLASPGQMVPHQCPWGMEQPWQEASADP